MNLSRLSETPTVWIGGTLRTDAVCLSASEFEGGVGVNQATITLRDPGSTPTGRIMDRELRSWYDDQPCAIHIGPHGCVHWGRISQVDFSLGSGEAITVRSTVSSDMLGMPLRPYVGHAHKLDNTRNDALRVQWFEGLVVLDKIAGDVVFNPVTNGVATPNLFVGNVFGSTNPVFLHPSQISRALLDEDRKNAEAGKPTKLVKFWSLRDAVAYVMHLRSQFMWGGTLDIDSAPAADIAAITDDPSLVRDVKLSIGSTVSEQLTKLLTPFGYRWCLEPRVTGDGAMIRIYERGKGIAGRGFANPIGLQRPRETLNTGMTTVKTMDVAFDPIDGVATSVEICGGVPHVETTIELRPAWDAIYDRTPGTVYPASWWKSFNRTASKSYLPAPHGTKDLDWEHDPARQRAWRYFCANEGGDYTGDAGRPWFTTTLDLAAHLQGDGTFAYDAAFMAEHLKLFRRRKLMPTLTTDGEGNHIGKTNGVYLEYWEPNSETWNPVVGSTNEDGRRGMPEARNIRILQDEIGVVFDADDPPTVLWKIAARHGMDALKLRVTGTIALDNVVSLLVSTGDAGAPVTSHLHRERRVILNQQDRFIVKAVDQSSVLHHLPLPKRESDPRSAMDALAKDTLWKSQQATISGEITLDGIVSGLLGIDVQEIAGRRIGFDSNPAGGFRRYPNVAGVTYDIQQQTTRIQLSTVRG